MVKLLGAFSKFTRTGECAWCIEGLFFFSHNTIKCWVSSCLQKEAGNHSFRTFVA